MTTPDPSRIAAEVIKSLGTLTYKQAREFVAGQKKFGLPRFLYKFRALQTARDIERLRHILLRSELWLSSPTNFNDPFDMAVKYVFDSTAHEKRERYKAALKAQGKKFHQIEQELPILMARTTPECEALADNSHRLTKNEIGVCSFGGNPRSILMWSHYSSNHKGVCLIFEIARDPAVFGQALEVQYSDQYPVVNWVSEMDRIKDAVLQKHKGWNYEKERRIVMLDRANMPLKFHPQALRAIIIGCGADAAEYRILDGLITERSAVHLPPVYLYECKMHQSDYQLRIFRRK
jgi:hypothetical protein